jgi:hypothetical protein
MGGVCSTKDEEGVDCARHLFRRPELFSRLRTLKMEATCSSENFDNKLRVAWGHNTEDGDWNCFFFLFRLDVVDVPESSCLPVFTLFSYQHVAARSQFV